MDSPRTVVCTICSNNYLHYARTLMSSVRSQHPDWHRVVLVVDEIQGHFDPHGEQFEVLELGRLGLPHERQFLFRYTILELNTAVKPWLLEWLFRERHADRVIYLDPDIRVYSPLAELQEAFDGGANIVLTPHLTGPLDDGCKPTEIDIILSGSWNLGFLGLASADATRDFLRWWQSKLEFDCVVDHASGRFVDQKWIELVPGMFPGVHNLRHDGYNVAYWNLKHRPIDVQEGQYSVHGQPLRFFHFSGLNPRRPETLSKFQTRFTLSTLPASTREVIENYCREVISNGLDECSRWPYAFGRFSDGYPIADLMRKLVREDADLARDAGENPFELSGESFNRPWSPRKRAALITVLMHHLWKSRSDLQHHYPDLAGGNRFQFAYWFVKKIARDAKLPDCYIEPVEQSLAKLGAIPGVSSRGRSLVIRAAHALKARAPRLPAGLTARLKRLVYSIPSTRQSGLRVGSAPATNSNPGTPAAGLNIVGYLTAEMGVGQSGRLAAAAAAAAGIPRALVNLSIEKYFRSDDETLLGQFANDNPYRVNLLHVNADQMPYVRGQLGEEFFQGRHTIGFWHWELAQFPDRWLANFDLVDEIWAPSQFVMNALAEKSPVPVVRMGHPISFELSARATRADYGLPENRFLFLLMYDMYSYQERKNPLAALRAFAQAFPSGQAGLVVKTMNGERHLKDLANVRRQLADVPGAILLDQTLSRQQVYDLESVCDAFVSLHRSEGFGLGLAECMYLGKPVVATNWSGNTDFMDAKNSCPIDFSLVPIKHTIGPYDAGQLWADPDVDHAAWHMRRLVEDPGVAARIGAAGQARIREEFSPQAVGRRYRQRLEVLTRRFASVSRLASAA